ncbi:hypothetical protein HPB47_012379 [Ixodes persulcatus]|uniref:Uncharacterized protein n=1 Tax=Ixodes persulcatus TaxID=34615 RepID=A0AC60NU09_IXOPE|nr:hypothetical protein HPB47_012379 [Ixodes persulcatus]
MTYDVSSTSSAADKDRSPRANRSPIDISKRSGVEKRFTEQSSRTQEPRHRAVLSRRREESFVPSALERGENPFGSLPWAPSDDDDDHGPRRSEGECGGERREKGLRYLRSTGGRPARQASLAAALSRARRAGLWRYSIKVASPPPRPDGFSIRDAQWPPGAYKGTRAACARGQPGVGGRTATGHACSQRVARRRSHRQRRLHQEPGRAAIDGILEGRVFSVRATGRSRISADQKKTVFFPPHDATIQNTGGAGC